jgi:short-subunit dehydrogenase
VKRLENKVALITGASSGIGEALARVFAQEGAKLALAARSLDKLRSLARSVGPDALPLQTDLSDRAQAGEMVRATAERFGRIDILVNNAGVGMYASVSEMSPEEFERLVATNWLGPVYAIQAVIPYLQKQGGGQIINISSVAGKVAIPWMAAYCGSKFALNAFSDSLRMELQSKNIQVISVCPGRVRTPFTENAFKDSGTRPLHPGGITAERVARAILSASLRGKRQIVVPASNWMFVWLHGVFPRFIDSMMLRVLRRGMRQR